MNDVILPTKEQISKDKTLKKILKSINRLKNPSLSSSLLPSLTLSERYEKYEELIRYLIAMMTERIHDNLLITTALWSLLNLLQLDYEYVKHVMLRAGIQTILYDILKIENHNLPQHTRGYASQLISALCSSSQSQEKEENISLQGSFLKSGVLGELSTDSISENESGLASFKPYYIDEKNTDLLNNLFQEDTLWKDISDTHQLGTALELESIHEDSVNNTTVNSSLSDFWDVMNQRYLYPGVVGNGPARRVQTTGSYRGGPSGPSSSRTRNKLINATQQSKLLGSSSAPLGHAPSSPSSIASRPTHTSRRNHLTPSKKLKSIHLPPHIESGLVARTSQTQTPVLPSVPPPNAIVPDYLAHLDPLSLNVTTSLNSYAKQQQTEKKKTLRKSTSSEYGTLSHEDRDGDDGTVGTGTALGTGRSSYFSKTEKLMVSKTKLSASHLQDMTFMRNFFLGKATLSDTHDLITRMQDILELMDKEDTGYITWKSFSRIILSLAPKELLRSNVTEFLSAQVSNENDLIDYKEFIITGKVLIIESKEGVKEVLARSWYARQKSNRLLEDGSSMYTWKNHIEWYRKRKAESVIWLMRRANRAIQYYKYVETARSYLLNIGKWGKDLSYLLECGDRALAAIDSSQLIRVSLHERIIHAIKYKQKREEARRYLISIAQSVIWDRRVEVTQPILIIPQPETIKIFPKLSNIYKVKYLAEKSFEILKKCGDRAKQKMEVRDQTFEYLKDLGQKLVKQQVVLTTVQQKLVAIGDKARDYCIILDTSLLFLLRKGERALDHFDRQSAALTKLISLGRRNIVFVTMKDEVTKSLRDLGQGVLKKLNDRENSFEYLTRRARNARKLLDNKKEAYWVLTGFMRKIYENEENLQNTMKWLIQRGERAKKHTESCLRAYRRLKTIAQRSVAVSRVRSMAYADLKQIGQQALRRQFEDTWTILPGNKDRLNDEIKRIKTSDKRMTASRTELSEEERWKAVLLDAFIGLATAYSKEPPPSISPSPSPSNRPESPPPVTRAESRSERDRPPSSSSKNRPQTAESATNELEGLELGRLGFKKLILDGKLLGLPKGTADSCYESVDSDASGCVSFSEVWNWFIFQARMKNRQHPGSVNIQIDAILPAKERALTTLMKRFNK